MHVYMYSLVKSTWCFDEWDILRNRFQVINNTCFILWTVLHLSGVYHSCDWETCLLPPFPLRLKQTEEASL